MVDGLGNLCAMFNKDKEGNSISEKQFDQQKFEDADLIVYGTSQAKEYWTVANPDTKIDVDQSTLFYYPMWAVYGNVVVESRIHRGNISELNKKTKTVWANKKPYILNGD